MQNSEGCGFLLLLRNPRLTSLLEIEQHGLGLP